MGGLRKFFAVLSVVAICGSLAATVGMVVPAGAAFPGANGLIAYARTVPSGTDQGIWVMNPDGTGQTRLTYNGGGEGSPAWSPDGAKIAFYRDLGGNGEVFVMNADGTGQTNLTNNGAIDTAPEWSPDGTKIAFVSTRVDYYDVWVMDADGTNATRLTTDPGFDGGPAWSPDGTKIAFSSSRAGGGGHIWVMDADGSNQTQLTTDPAGGDFEANWSPDGTKIVFGGTIPPVNLEIYVINADGTGRTNVSNHPRYDSAPAWSPDGTKITFHSDRGNATGYSDIYVMDADGDNQTNVSNHADIEGGPDWQPIDVTDPTITLATPPDGAIYSLNQVVNADYSCQDEAGGSGLASCVGDVPNGSAIDTGSVGSKTFTVDAADNAGNDASVSHSYQVEFAFSGFFSPVNNLPVLNSVQAGRSIPVKFSLSGNQGLGIVAATYPRSESILCSSTVPVDGIEETVTAGSSSLTYDATTDQYHYVWKTNKSWAGSCRQFVVKLIDGTVHRANFKFK